MTGILEQNNIAITNKITFDVLKELLQFIEIPVQTENHCSGLHVLIYLERVR